MILLKQTCQGILKVNLFPSLEWIPSIRAGGLCYQAFRCLLPSDFDPQGPLPHRDRVKGNWKARGRSACDHSSPVWLIWDDTAVISVPTVNWQLDFLGKKFYLPVIYLPITYLSSYRSINLSSIICSQKPAFIKALKNVLYPHTIKLKKGICHFVRPLEKVTIHCLPSYFVPTQQHLLDFLWVCLPTTLCFLGAGTMAHLDCYFHCSHSRTWVIFAH